MKSESRFRNKLSRLRLRFGIKADKAVVFLRGDMREKYDLYRSNGLSHEQAVDKLAWYFGVPKEKLLKKYKKP